MESARYSLLLLPVLHTELSSSFFSTRLGGHEGQDGIPQASTLAGPTPRVGYGSGTPALLMSEKPAVR